MEWTDSVIPIITCPIIYLKFDCKPVPNHTIHRRVDDNGHDIETFESI